MTRLAIIHWRNLATLSVGAFFIAACASSVPRSKPAVAHIEIQEQIGFTITEDARVGDDTRLDYEQAVSELERGNQQEGIRLLQAVADATPELSAPRIDLGIAYHRAGDLVQAERNLRLALENNPSHPIANNELGIVLRKTGRFREARSNYEAALAVYPGYHYARRNLAVLCDLYLADLDCALQNYQAYMTTVPSDDEASMWIKDLQYRLNQREEQR
ncbi:MAG: tetratricopeptide repeat protein [Gammaproteobacteria bacterium]|nr:tetratricopeptide repeat protein [Gammaproteobacteria bacterium]